MMRSLPKTFLALGVAATLVGSLGCGSDPAAPDRGELAGGVLATFDVSGEEFHVWTDDGAAVQQLLDVEAGRSQATIPNGRLLEGPGRGEHNAPWSWHLDPQDLTMAEVTAEVCDGRPSFVESDLEYWLNEVGRFCPWSAELVELQDFR